MLQVKKASDKQIMAAILIQKHYRAYVARKSYPKLLKRHKKKTYIAMELIQSERTYCSNLQYVIKEVLIPSKNLITEKDMHGYLFSNI